MKINGAQPRTISCNGPQRVVASSWVSPDGEVYTLPRPMRHHNVRNYIFRSGIAEKHGWKSIDGELSGFILSNGKHVRRPVALQQGKMSGQFPDNMPLIGGGILTSEDIFDINGYDIWTPDGDPYAFRPYEWQQKQVENLVFLGGRTAGMMAGIACNYHNQISNWESRDDLHLKSPLAIIYRRQLEIIRKAFLSFDIQPDHETLVEIYKESDAYADPNWYPTYGSEVRDKLELYL